MDQMKRRVTILLLSKFSHFLEDRTGLGDPRSTNSHHNKYFCTGPFLPFSTDWHCGWGLRADSKRVQRTALESCPGAI